MPLRKIAARRTPPAVPYGELLQGRRDRRPRMGSPLHRAMVSFYRSGVAVASGHAFSLRAIAAAEAHRRKGSAASEDRRPENPASRALW